MSYPNTLSRAGLRNTYRRDGTPGEKRKNGPFAHSPGLQAVASRVDQNVMPNPHFPLNRIGFTIPASGFSTFEVTDCRVLYFAESVVFGTGAGDLSIQFGETGDQIRLAPGDLIKLSGFRRFKIFNNTAVAKSGAVIVTADPFFEWNNYPRGI